ncbi:MAG: CoA transferase [Rhodospirillaceae bacterium]|nr:CoA transferase [Rhodospirillaceae bacterium]
MNDETAATGPLKGIRVVEMGQLIAGPFCGQLMGDFGAEVIKVEPPGIGDPMREWGQQKKDGRPLWWSVIARNKKSLTLDLRQPEGQEIARQVIAKSDVLIENFRPGTLEKWGMDYATLSKLNPRLVMIRVSGYGQTGPYAKRPGYGQIGEAMGGLRYVIGDPDRVPARAGISIGDSLAATYACLGGIMALYAREKTGRGQVVDSAIYEAVLAMMESLVIEYDQTGYIRERTGSILPGIAPSNIYAAKDGALVMISGNQDSVFKRLSKAMDQPELATDPRFVDHTARGKNLALLDDIIGQWTKALMPDEILKRLEANDVPAGVAYRGPEMFADAQYKARQTIAKVAHPFFGEVAMQNVAPRMSETPGNIRWVGPELGSHNEAILSGLLKMSAAEIARLKQARII